MKRTIVTQSDGYPGMVAASSAHSTRWFIPRGAGGLIQSQPHTDIESSAVAYDKATTKNNRASIEQEDSSSSPADGATTAATHRLPIYAPTTLYDTLAVTFFLFFLAAVTPVMTSATPPPAGSLAIFCCCPR